ncbi:MAG: hypothetical protein ISS92_06865 [Candidatus Omnitrophica bacterium]|nr:hypothetical protein [Candidatus Omnitrophota bacterium]
MKPSRHVIASFSLGLVLWFFTKSAYAALLCFFSGILVDSDHILEYIIHHGLKGITFNKIYQASVETSMREGDYVFKRLYLVLHAYEIVIFLWLVTAYTKNIYFLAVTLGFSLHLALDSMGNSELYPLSYFILWRTIKKFDAEKLFKKRSKIGE